MLLTINPLLTGELLKLLDDMGHSDFVVIADANFPAHRMGRPVVEVPGVDAVTMTAAVAEVLPLDDDNPPALMESDLNPRPAVQEGLLNAAGTSACSMVDRWAYYDLARRASVIVATGELRVWANITLYKGLCHLPA